MAIKYLECQKFGGIYSVQCFKSTAVKHIDWETPQPNYIIVWCCLEKIWDPSLVQIIDWSTHTQTAV